MSHRSLYVAAYDVSDDGRLRAALRLLKGFASGRQKSVFECFLSDAEKRDMLAGVRELLDEHEDRFVLLRLDPRGTVRTLGKAVQPTDRSFIYVG